MNLIVTDEAKRALKMDDHDKMIQLSFDQGSCDIVNTIYEIKVIPKRDLEPNERIISVDNISFIIDDKFEEIYDHELVIDYAGGFFVFKNRSQIFNNRIVIRKV